MKKGFLIIKLIRSTYMQVGFPRLERLSINGITKFTKIWSNKLAPASFCRLKDIKVQRCNGMTNMFLSSMIGRLNALKTLYIWYCESLRVVFEHREIVKESHHTIAATPSENFYCQNLVSVHIGLCGSLKNIFPTSMARGDLRLLRELKVEACYGVEEIVAEAEELETSMLKFVFPKITSMTFRELPQLRSFYPGLHTSEWPLLKTLDVYICDQVEIFSAEIWSFQKAHELVGPFTSIKQPFFLIEKVLFAIFLDSYSLYPWLVWFFCIKFPYSRVRPNFFPFLRGKRFNFDHTHAALIHHGTTVTYLHTLNRPFCIISARIRFAN